MGTIGWPNKRFKEVFEYCHSMLKLFWFLLRISSLIHLTNGSPLYPSSQLQIALWLTTWHLACKPQTPSHGFLQRWLMHDLSRAHSELTKHSGRQFGGAPIISGKQLHTAWLSSSRHWLFKPQGVGVQGVSIGVAWTEFVEDFSIRRPNKHSERKEQLFEMIPNRQRLQNIFVSNNWN